MGQLFTVAWRSIWRNRRRTVITVSSIALGLAFAIFFVAMGDGIYAKFIEDVVRVQGGHVTLEDPAYRDAPAVDLVVGDVAGWRRRIEELPQVQQTKALVLGQGVARSGAAGVGVAIIGVEPSAEASVSPLARKIVSGEFLADDDARRAVIGRQLAKQLRLEVGKKLVLASNNVRGELVEELVRVKGIFELGAPEADGYLVQVPLDFARKLYAMGADEATEVGVILHDARDLSEVLTTLRSWTDPERIAVLRWDEVLADIAAFITIDSGSNYVFQAIILFLIMFTIFNTILMSVLERRREFAVLLALGTPPTWLRAQVMVETALIGLVGCSLGIALGGGLAYIFKVRGLDLSAMIGGDWVISGYTVDPVIHFLLTPRMLLWMGGLVFGATLLLGVYPMLRSTRVAVADLLR